MFTFGFLSAREAKEQSDAINKQKFEAEAEEIKDEINKAINNGECCVTIENSLSQAVLTELKLKGYTIEVEECGYYGTLSKTTISW